MFPAVPSETHAASQSEGITMRMKKQNRWAGDRAVESAEDQVEGGAPSVAPEAEVSPLAADQLDAFLFLLEEEKLAGDLYDLFYETSGLKVFDRISNSEDNHFDNLAAQADKLGVDISAILALPDGEYVNPEVQAMYDAWSVEGVASTQTAIEIAVEIETTDIEGLKDAAESVDVASLETAYLALAEASARHLDSFDNFLA